MARVRTLPRLHRLELSPLPRDEAVALAERLLADNPAATPASAATVADEAAGHPLFIDALARHTAIRSTAAPPLRLSDALWARITELDPPAQHLLALLAVAGGPLAPELLTAAGVLPTDEIDPALVRLRQAHLARVVDSTSKGIEPYHDRVREAVLDHVDPDLRRTCHRALARVLLALGADRDPAPDARESVVVAAPPPSSASGASWGPEAVAVHLHAAGDLEQAARYTVLAADQAAAALAFDRTARLYRQALAIQDELGPAVGPLGDTRDVLLRLARALVNAGRGAEAAAVYFELARKAAATGEENLELWLRGAEQLLRSGHRDDGWRALAEVLDELELSPATTRAGAVWRLLWRRAWVRLRGFASPAPDRQATTPPRELLRLEVCQVAWLMADVTGLALSAEYRTRYQVLALKSADPRHTALALVMEVYIAMLSGNAGVRRAARLMDEVSAMVKRSDDPYLLGVEQATRAFIALALGQWARSREHGAQAMQLFRERCLGASLETMFVAVRYSYCLFYMGALRDAMRELLPLWREAEERGNRYARYSGNKSLLTLVHDQPEAARQVAERAMAPWTATAAEGDVPSDLLGRIAHAEIDLYEGNGAAAYRRIDQDWHRSIASPLARLAFIRARMLGLHGVAALAACRSGEPDRRLVRDAVRDARSLRAMRMPWTCALARILDAGVALATGARDEARELFERAHAELSAAGVNLHATLARRRVGELAGGAEGARILAEADAWLAAQEVRAPERLARIYVPEVA
jgi:eukaryotic-like serine/threonine-protein kinase